MSQIHFPSIQLSTTFSPSTSRPSQNPDLVTEQLFSPYNVSTNIHQIQHDSSDLEDSSRHSSEGRKQNFVKPVNLVRKRSSTLGNSLLQNKFGNKEEIKKSMNINEVDSSSSESLENFDRKSVNHPKEEEKETYFNRKVRVLETKFKKFKLDNETVLMKARQENSALKAEIQSIKKFISASYPKIYEQIQNLDHDYLSEASSDSEFEEISMPMQSQILQIKIQGKSLCDKIKDLQSLVALEESFNKKLLEELEQMKNSKQSGGRRWSTHTSPFEMRELYSGEDEKLNFQAKTEAETTNEVSFRRQCMDCIKLKKHLISLNEGLKKIKID